MPRSNIYTQRLQSEFLNTILQYKELRLLGETADSRTGEEQVWGEPGTPSETRNEDMLKKLIGACQKAHRTYAHSGYIWDNLSNKINDSDEL